MDVLDRIRRVLEAEPAVRFALLHGSRARGGARPESDWDVGVYLDDALDPDQRFEVLCRLSAELNGPRLPAVDLVVLNDAPPLLAQRALGGELVVDRDRQAYVRFFVRTMGLAEDERYYSRRHEEARRRRLEEGRFGRP